MLSMPSVNVPARPVRRPPARIGTSRPGDQSDPSAVERIGASGEPPPAEEGRAAERERPLVREEELPLFRKEQAEPRQVDLLLVGFDLREVGVAR